MEIRTLAVATALAATTVAGAAETLESPAICGNEFQPGVELVEYLVSAWEPWNLRYYEGYSGTMYVIADTRPTSEPLNYEDSPERDEIWFLAVADQYGKTCVVAASEDIFSVDVFSELGWDDDNLTLSCSAKEFNEDWEGPGVVSRSYQADGPLAGTAVAIETSPSSVEKYGSSIFIHRLLVRNGWHLLLVKNGNTCWLAH